MTEAQPTATPPGAPAAPAAQPSAFAVLRRPDFRYLWTGQLISTIGDSLTSLAASIIIWRLTESALSVGLMLMVTVLPTLVFGLIGGVVVDRFDRKRIMIASSLLSAVIVAAIPFLVGLHIAWLYVAVMVNASVNQFFAPANESVLPEIATDEELGAANSIMAIAQFGSTAVGFAAAGLLATTANIEIVFFVDAATFVFAAVMIWLVKIAPRLVVDQTSVSEIIRNLGVGAQFIARTPILRSVTLLRVPVLVVFGLQNVLLLPFAITALHASEFEFGLQEGMTSVGFVVGSLLMARLADRLREGQWLVISLLGMGLAGLAYSFTSSIVLAIGLIAISGLLNAPTFIAGRLIQQRHTPADMRGRVFSTSYLLRDIVYLGGMGLAGLADIIDIRFLFATSSILLIATALVGAVLPGLGQPAAEWRRAISLLRAAPGAPGLAAGRTASMADLELLGRYWPVLSGLTPRDREALIERARVRQAAPGTAITRAGDQGDAAFFILSGRVVAGTTSGEGEYRALSSMLTGDIFGEIAAITGSVRTADVVAEEETTLLEIPADTLRTLMNVPEFGKVVLGKMSERLSRTASITDLPRFGGADHRTLQALRKESASSGETAAGEPV